jgi:2-polyprenyl-3-methyl-5-hydroxy-6-metoxy-1,4-benzoquinol methylase
MTPEATRWDARYLSKDTPWDTGFPSKELERVLREDGIKPCRAIDLGCGTGTNAVYLASLGFEVTGIDLSATAVGKARERATAAGVRVNFLEADVLNPPDLTGPFDFVFDRGCYHCVRRLDVDRFLETLRGLVGPKTVALFLTGNAREKQDPGPPVTTEEEIRGELGKVLEILRLREFRFDQPAEKGLPFLGWSCLSRTKYRQWTG